ncbi:MAG TPA: germination protein YpeB [Clostridia bacterium]|nr:germination protein YpeB [Clostridia bacterium]
MRRWYGWLMAALLVVAVLAFGFGYWKDQQRVANALESNYQRDFHVVVDQVEQLEALLGKGLVSASPRQQIFLLTEIWGRANTAQGALGQLPFTEINLSASRKFLAQMGDYAYTLAKRLAGGEELTGEHKAQLQAFYEEVRRYGQVLAQTEARLFQNGYRWTKAVMAGSGGKGRVPNTEAVDDGLDGFKEMEQRFAGLPVLIYDGPFSDHVGQGDPKSFVAHAQAIEEQEARRRAEQFVNQPGDGSYQAMKSERVEGTIPVYGITLDGKRKPGTVTADVSIKGGEIIAFLNSRPVSAARLSESEAEAKAAAFLRERGFEHFEKTFSLKENNVLWIVYVAKEGAVRLYPDQVKVQVALDNGEVIGFDATMYYLNHRERELLTPSISEEEAREKLSGELTVKSSRLALIPLSGEREALTYEFTAEYGGEQYLVYINAMTGEEENILKVVPVPQGQLAM